MKRLTRRAVLSISATSLGIKPAFALLRFGARSGGSSNANLATLTLVNDGGSTMPAGTVSPMFGWPFKKGDIPTGTAPQFVVSGQTQPYSWGLRTYWSDGSLKFASFFFRATFPLNAGASQAVQIWNGGTPPSASGRTLTEVYAQSIQTTVTGANNSGTPISGANLTGSLGAWLLADSNNWQQKPTHDGVAGKAWRVRCHMAVTQGAAASNQFDTSFFVAALTDASGNSGGFRVLPVIENQWYNTTGGTTTNLACYQPTVSWQYGSGSPTIVDMATAGTFPFANQAFTITSGAAATDSANNYYQGAGNGVGYNYLMCYVTGTGNGLTANTIYICRANNNGTNGIVFYSESGSSWSLVSLSGNGTNTLVPINYHDPYAPFPLPTSGGRWNEFQGTGSGNTGTSTSLRVQIDREYWHSTRVMPPYDMSIKDSVVDNNWGASAPGGSYNYTPITVGPWTWDATAGERSDLGILPSEHVIDFYTRSAFSDKLVRVTGYAGNCMLFHLRDYATGQVVNNRNASYTGMPAFQGDPNLITWGNGTNAVGIVNPTNYMLGYTNDTSHQPCSTPWAYLRTGEPQYLDILVDLAIGAIIQNNYDNTNRNPTTPGAPYADYGLVTVGNAQMRSIAWALRNIIWAAALCPNPYYDGSQLWNNLDDLATANTAWPYNLLNNSSYASVAWGGSASYVTANGMWVPSSQVNGFTPVTDFELSFFTQAMCLSAATREDANALGFINFMKTRALHIAATFGYWYLYTIQSISTLSEYNTNGWTSGPVISSDAQFAITCYNGPPGPITGLSWDSTGPGPGGQHFEWSGTGTISEGYVPANNDRVLFMSASLQTPPNPFSSYTPYYAVNVNGNWFDLSATQGGSPINPTVTGIWNTFLKYIYLAPANSPSTANGNVPIFGPPTQSSYCCNFNAWTRWAMALGETGLSNLDTDARARLTNGAAYSPTLDPRYSMQSTF